MKRLALLALVMATACSRKPGPPPGVDQLSFPVPEVWRRRAEAEPPATWLDEIGQVELTRLVLEAWQRNPDLRATLATIGQAQSQVALVASGLGLQLQATGNAARARTNVLVPGDPTATPPTPPMIRKVIGNDFTVGLSVAWELDLWGGIRAERSAAAAEFGAALHGGRWAHLSLAAQVARSWLNLVAARRQQELAEAIEDNLRRALAIVEERFEAGLANAFEVRAARMELAAAEAVTADLVRLHENAGQALELLVGRYPAGGIATEGDLPELPGPVAAGLPGELLARRPDVSAAALRAWGAGERIWSAKTAFFPRITLTAGGGYRSEKLNQLFDPERLVWNLLGGLTQPLLDGGRNRANLQLRRAQQVELLARYQATVLQAFGEVEMGLAAEEHLAVRATHLAKVLTEAKATERQGREQYDAGNLGLLEVMQFERRRLDAERGVVAVALARWDNRLSLYLALGGFALGAVPDLAAGDVEREP